VTSKPPTGLGFTFSKDFGASLKLSIFLSYSETYKTVEQDDDGWFLVFEKSNKHSGPESAKFEQNYLGNVNGLRIHQNRVFFRGRGFQI